jgi:hypothetical protein
MRAALAMEVHHTQEEGIMGWYVVTLALEEEAVLARGMMEVHAGCLSPPACTFAIPLGWLPLSTGC